LEASLAERPVPDETEEAVPPIVQAYVDYYEKLHHFIIVLFLYNRLLEQRLSERPVPGESEEAIPKKCKHMDYYEKLHEDRVRCLRHFFTR
jgi:hypothetical protein